MAAGRVETFYDSKKELGRGAYASVWSAVKRSTREYRAIKTIDFEHIRWDKLEKTLAQVSAVPCHDLQLHSSFAGSL